MHIERPFLGSKVSPSYPYKPTINKEHGYG
jgi:hypothetical protein